MNVLYHTSFDEGFPEYPTEPHLLVPSGWHPVWTPGDKPGPVRPEIQPEIRNRGDKGIRTGEHGLKLAHAWAFFDAALYMHLATSPGLHYLASAWVTAESDDGLACRVGLDPTGGAEILSPTVHWSNWWGTDNPGFKPYEWKQVAVESLAAGNQMTLFLRATAREPVQVNAGFFDDVTFSGENRRPPTDGNLLELVDELVLQAAGLREYVITQKRDCLLL